MIVHGGGSFPKTVDTLLKVPGIGNYTAGAIASIAFKEVSLCTSYSFLFSFFFPMDSIPNLV